MSSAPGPRSNEQLLEELRAFADKLAATLSDVVQAAALTLKSKLPFKVLSIRELLLHRVSQLASAAVESFEQRRVVAAAALTRAVVETVAVLFALHERVVQFLKEENIDEFDDFLTRTLMGGRNNPEMPVATNVLTLIDRLHVEVEGARPIYDALCEITHPNWAGVLGSFGELDQASYELRLGPRVSSRSSSVGLNALSGSLLTFQHFYNELAAKIEELNEYFEESSS